MKQSSLRPTNNRYISRLSSIDIRKLFSFCLLPVAYCMLLLVSSCDTPEKVLKSTDIEYKKAKAIFWYNKKEYYKCIPVLEELIGLMKGRQNVEELYYMYCMANYKQGDYMISAYHFKNFYDQYPANERSEECLFMYAKSYQQLSPKPDLDQTYTNKALEAYSFFLNIFPESKYVGETNEAVAKLRKKLEKKALSNAELYYKTGNFKAAATCYENVLKEFPDLEDPEKVNFLIIKSSYKYAFNSISQKKADRYKAVIAQFDEFKRRYPNSKLIAEGTKYQIQSYYLAVMGAFEWAETAALDDREGAFNLAFKVADQELPFITSEKQKAQIAELKEKGHFLIVKYNYLLSEIRKIEQKLPTLKQTINTYYIFVDLFPRSRYAKEAEKIFNNSTEQIKRIETEQNKKPKTNG
jgi:outer membrane protein assembly factor BamD